ncbi:MAG: ADP-ribosylglycohydrolase family protein [Anaerolineales bacterium]|nr:ADP-ribosylglycohydrolase family protein [Anaerolineales bacterium]
MPAIPSADTVTTSTASSCGSERPAVVQVVNLGNDADTAGTVVGALAGATYGLQAIPARWQKALRGEWPLKSGMHWGVAELIALADRLVGCSSSKSSC